MTTLPRLIAGGAVAFLLASAAPHADVLIRRPAAEQTPPPRAAAAQDHVVAGISSRPNGATADEIVLSADDGTADGTAILSEGLTLVTRLTPKVYPVKVTKVRILFVKLSGQPDPVGQSVRLLVFTDPSGSGKPPQSPKMAVDRSVTIPSTGAYVDFPVDGPIVDSGDIYVGYQAPRPSNGVGFGADSNGTQYERGFYSTDGGATFQGPVRFSDGTRFNPLIRAVAQVSSPDGPSVEELFTDDSTVETGLLRAGGMYVNRLTPSRYPARLEKVKVYVVGFQGQPSPTGRKVRLVVFRDPSGKGKPPDSVTMDVDTNVALGAENQFQEIAVDGPTIDSGDVYVGYQAPDPHEGVGFAVDMSGASAGRAFRSTDGGKTFAGPIEVTWNNTNAAANLCLRAVVRYGSSNAGGKTFQLAADHETIDLSEGPGAVTFQVGIAKTPAWTSPVRLTAKTDPAGVPVQVSVVPDTVNAGERATVTLSGLQAFEGDTFRVVIAGESESARSSLEVPANRWRVVRTETVGPEGNVIDAGGVTVRIPGGALRETAVLTLLTGKPPTGLEQYHASSIYRLEGLPSGFDGTVEIAQAAGKSAARTAGETLSVAAVMIPTTTISGKIASTTRMVTASVGPAATTAQVDAKKLKLEKRFTFWFLKGYYAAQTTEGHFLIYYPITFTDAATAIGNHLEKALNVLETESVGIYLTARVSLPINVTLKPLKDTVFGDCDGEALFFNTLKLKTADDITAFENTPGHELMHLAQAQYGGHAPAFAGFHDTFPWYWMDEALSTWFEPYAMRRPDYIPTTVCPSCGTGTNTSDNYRSFVEQGLNPPGTAADENHGYGASMFLTKLYRGDERLISKLLHNRVPSESAVTALANAVGGVAELSKKWGEFASDYFAGVLYPGRRFPALTDLFPTGDSRFLAFQSSVDDSKKFNWLHAPELSMRMFSVPFTQAKSFPDLTDTVVLSAKVAGGYDDVDLYVYSCDSAGGEFLGTASGKSEVIFPDSKKLAADRKTILIGTVNRRATAAFNSTRDIAVQVGLAPPTVTISPDYSKMKGVTNYAYQFTTVNRNIPSDAVYTWVIDGVSMTGRSVSYTFKRPGSYQVEVSASGTRTTAGDRITFVIAEDTPSTNQEVLFEVYRNYKNPFGSSKQKCNNYNITVTNTAGRSWSGESIAMNGAYTMTLATGYGYQYAVNYTYTGACAGSGRITGKFDVKSGINYVPIETPPCEQ